MDSMSGLRNVAVGMYVDEPCQICGERLTMEDIERDAVFVGYTSDNTSRAAHKGCWDRRIPKEMWAKQ